MSDVTKASCIFEPKHELLMHFVGFSQRLLAFNIDLIPFLVLLYALNFILPNSSYDPFIIGSVYLLYFTAFESSSWRASPGKRYLRLMIVDKNKQPVHAGKLLLRNLLKLVSLLLFFIGFIMILFHEKRQGLHDYLLGTYVIQQPGE